MKNLKTLLICLLATGLFQACSGDKTKTQENETKDTPAENTVSDDPMANKGIGPVTSVTLAPEIDKAMADKGMEVYESKCSACHKTEEKFIGPAPKGILDRRSPEWVMNMILNPEEMTQKDPIARALLIEFNGSPMANQNLTQEEARSVLEYFRTL